MVGGRTSWNSCFITSQILLISASRAHGSSRTCAPAFYSCRQGSRLAPARDGRGVGYYRRMETQEPAPESGSPLVKAVEFLEKGEWQPAHRIVRGGKRRRARGGEG